MKNEICYFKINVESDNNNFIVPHLKEGNQNIFSQYASWFVKKYNSCGFTEEYEINAGEMMYCQTQFNLNCVPCRKNDKDIDCLEIVQTNPLSPIQVFGIQYGMIGTHNTDIYVLYAEFDDIDALCDNIERLNINRNLFFSSKLKMRYQEQLNGYNNKIIIKNKKSISKNNKKPVLCVETNTRYESIAEAARTVDCSAKQIIAVLKGYQTTNPNGKKHTVKTAGGYHWQYV